MIKLSGPSTTEMNCEVEKMPIAAAGRSE